MSHSRGFPFSRPLFTERFLSNSITRLPLFSLYCHTTLLPFFLISIFILFFFVSFFFTTNDSPGGYGVDKEEGRGVGTFRGMGLVVLGMGGKGFAFGRVRLE